MKNTPKSIMSQKQLRKVNWLLRQQVERCKLKDLRTKMEKRMVEKQQSKIRLTSQTWQKMKQQPWKYVNMYHRNCKLGDL